MLYKNRGDRQSQAVGRCRKPGKEKRVSMAGSETGKDEKKLKSSQPFQFKRENAHLPHRTGLPKTV